jgi:tetratricopeptide (TPR) repeat protein
MTIAVLPFNAGPNTNPAFARQFANFASEIVRPLAEGHEIGIVDYMVRVDESANSRLARVNPSEGLNEPQMVMQIFEQAPAAFAIDGLLVQTDGRFTLDLRVFERGNEVPVETRSLSFGRSELFAGLREVVGLMAARLGVAIPDEMSRNEGLFGTTKPEAFLKFLEGFDALQYIEKTQGNVVHEFSPEHALNMCLGAIELDGDWEAPYLTLIQLGRVCAGFRIGNPEGIERALKRAQEAEPDDWRATFALAELYQAVSNLTGASDAYERAHGLASKGGATEQDQGAILSRLGLLQLQMGMPANAERNLRKAIALEGDDKPSMDFLANVLMQTNRAHEAPALWKGMIDNNPENALAHAKYAASLISAGREDEGVAAFERALSELDDAVAVKRFYAPYLAHKKEYDRAMDLFEDCIDAAPADVQLLIEYAQTLQAAGRGFEAPAVLRNVLNANPDPNTRAQVLAWQMELEQPKRVETVQQAQAKIDAEDFEGALKLLRPLRNWLADYWKMWLLYAAANNRAGEHREAEDACMRLVNLFPGCEPGWAELATALTAQSKLEEAYNAMRMAMTQVPGSLPTALNLALAAKRVGHTDEARALAKQIREAAGQNQDLAQQLAPVLDDLDS